MNPEPRLEFESRLAEHLSSRVEPGCLEAESLIELAEMGPKARDFDRRMAHVASCSRCYALLGELRGMPAVKPEAERANRSWLWVLVPVGAALIIFSLVRQAQDRERIERFVKERHAPPEVRFDPGFGPPKGAPLEARGPEPKAPPETASETPPDPGREFIPFEPPERPSEGPLRLGGYFFERDGRLFEGDVPIEDFVAADVRLFGEEPENVRGPREPDPPEIVLEQPEIGNRLLRDAKPSFEWRRHPGATGYEVTLMRLPDPSATGPVPVELEIAGLAARPKSPLEAGGTYRLRITAKGSAGDPVGERNPFSEYVFRVPDDEARRKLAWAAANESKAPVASAMVYRALGRLADAERIMPRSDEPKMLAWRRNIEESLKRRLSESNR